MRVVIDGVKNMLLIEGIAVVIGATFMAIWINDNFAIGGYDFDSSPES